MEYTLPLQTITDAWMKALKDSDSIQQYCKDHYGKAPVLINGGNPREAPDGDYCPYIVENRRSRPEYTVLYNRCRLGREEQQPHC